MTTVAVRMASAVNAKGFAALDEQIKKLNELGKITSRVAPKVAVAAKEELRKQVASQQGPSGKQWEESEDGKSILTRAAEVARVFADGTTVLMVLGGHYARHHLGAVKGKKKREILPNARIPATITKAIKRVVIAEFHATMRTKK